MIAKSIRVIKIEGRIGEFKRAMRVVDEIETGEWVQVVNDKPLVLLSEKELIEEMNGVERAIMRIRHTYK